jgi:hypothetical protein
MALGAGNRNAAPRLGETLLRKYEAAAGASQKIEAPFGYLKIR